MNDKFFDKYGISLKTLITIINNPDMVDQFSMNNIITISKYSFDIFYDIDSINDKNIKIGKQTYDKQEILQKYDKFMSRIFNTKKFKSLSEQEKKFKKKYEIDPNDIFLKQNVEKYILSNIDAAIICDKNSLYEICIDYQKLYDNYNINDFFEELYDYRYSTRSRRRRRNAVSKPIYEGKPYWWDPESFFGND